MKLLFDDATGVILARYSDNVSPMPGMPSFEPVTGPGQILVDAPADIIGEAVIGIMTDGTLVVDPVIIENQWTSVRSRRNSLLAECDWICSITDYTVPNKDAWIVYRQALRDITKGDNPYTVVWPVV
jgi:hypothetical protein